MPRWIGFLGSWALLVLGLGLAATAVAGEWINIRDLRRLQRVETIDRMIAERMGQRAEALRHQARQKNADVQALQSRLAQMTQQTEDVPDTGQTVVVSTSENKLYVRRNGRNVFEAVCSTGKGTTLVVDGRTMVFDTPTGKFRIKGKEENPVWVPPDWHYVELARKQGKEIIRLHRGSAVDAHTGRVVRQRDEGVWSWFGGGPGSGRTFRVRGNTVVEDHGSYERPLPPATVITAGNVIVIP
ncbi:MAG TPA: L,D-transpeptidase, partial [Thermoanaerobaculia bacterium]|nr:L,D-transpeptidase [Thermoanaerobaculia bacterium]